jgi:hypothetical protein
MSYSSLLIPCGLPFEEVKPHFLKALLTGVSSEELLGCVSPGGIR